MTETEPSWKPLTSKEFTRRCYLARRVISDERSIIEILRKDRGFSYLMKPRKIGELTALARQLYNEGGLALTVTFKEDLRNTHDEESLRDIMMDVLDLTDCVYVMFPDIDEKGNYHYHGIVKLRHRERVRIKRLFTKPIGFIKFTLISDIDVWLKYMRKDIGFKSKEHPAPLKAPILTDLEVEELSAVSRHIDRPSITDMLIL